MLNGNEGHSTAVNTLADWLSACAHEDAPSSSTTHMGMSEKFQNLPCSLCMHQMASCLQKATDDIADGIKGINGWAAPMCLAQLLAE